LSAAADLREQAGGLPDLLSVVELRDSAATWVGPAATHFASELKARVSELGRAATELGTLADRLVSTAGAAGMGAGMGARPHVA